MIPEGKTQKEFATEAMEMLLDDLNIMGSDKPIVDGIIEALRTNHRTLNQNFFRVIIEVIKQYAEFKSDLRNEASVNFCKFVAEKLEEDKKQKYVEFKTPVEYLPFI